VISSNRAKEPHPSRPAPPLAPALPEKLHRRYPDFLQMLPQRDRDFLLSKAVEKTVKKGQVLYHQGDPSDNVFIILKGAIKIHYLYGSGSSFTTSYYRDGMLVGAHGHSEWAGNHSWSAQALVESRVLWLRRSHIVELVEGSTDALKSVLAIVEFKSQQLKKVIRLLATPTLEERIFMAINYLGEIYGIEHADGIEIGDRFTHQEIAEMVGASRQSVTTLLVSLEKAGHIRREGRKIFIRAKP
jgi:CRP/FNR family transcriptional regulator, cyclic AMP receptor protein